MHIINLIRVKDWLKNILIFFPLIYSGLLFDQSYYTILILGFITFCTVASCIYMINDILDVERDKQHPIKKFTKPIAAKKVSIKIPLLATCINACSISTLKFHKCSKCLCIIHEISY